MCVCVCMCCVCVCVCDLCACIQFHLSVFEIGLIGLIDAVTYVVLCLVTGPLYDRLVSEQQLLYLFCLFSTDKTCTMHVIVYNVFKVLHCCVIFQNGMNKQVQLIT